MDNLSDDTDQLVLQLVRSLNLNQARKPVKLIGVLFADKPPRAIGLKKAIQSSWKRFGAVGVEVAEDNLVAISVDNPGVAQSILEESPWSIMGIL